MAGSSANVIGAAEDNTYTDGLFVSWTANTPIGTAMDNINEVLAGLAPKPAPYIDQAGISASASGATSGGLIISSDATLDSVDYYAVDSDSISTTDLDNPFSNVGKGSIYSSLNLPSSGDLQHIRLGVIGPNTSVPGVINDTVGADGVNYPANAFGYADQGALTLYVNAYPDPSKQSVSQASSAPQEGVPYTDGSIFFTVTLLESANENAELNSNGSGLYLSAPQAGAFSAERSFPLFKHRTGTWAVSHLDQRPGWNYVLLEHILSDGSRRYSQFVEWFRDADTSSMQVTSSSLSTPSLTGSNYLSGVNYYTGGSVGYSASFSNVYKNVYPTGSVTFSGTNCSAAAVSIPAIGSSEDNTKVLSISNHTLTISSTGLVQNISVGSNLNHPTKGSLSNAGTQSLSGLVIYNATGQNPTDLKETFKSEAYRKQSGSYPTQSSATANAWQSSDSLTDSSGTSHLGLLVYDGTLRSPKQGLNGGDFAGATYSQATVDYSNVSGTHSYYRAFLNNSNSTKKSLTLKVNGSGTTIVPAVSASSLTSSGINIYFKVPDKTGWMDIASVFVPGNTSDGAGAYQGAFNSTPSSSNSNTLTVGQLVNIVHGDYIIIRVEADSSWTGSLSTIEVDWS